MTDKSGITENKIQRWKEWGVNNILISNNVVELTYEPQDP